MDAKDFAELIARNNKLTNRIMQLMETLRLKNDIIVQLDNENKMLRFAVESLDPDYLYLED